MKVCLDSRLIKKGEYFVPVIGENFDGHKFINSALQNGAAGIIEEKELYKIAKQKLKKINPVVIAITGSVGKTTTRDFIATLLKTKYSVCVGDLNTKLGLATNIVNNMQDTCKIFVAECGMDKKGELTQTGKFIEPKIVVLTNISQSHMQKLGSIENIVNAKAELIKTLPKNGVLYYNQSNKYCSEVAKKYGPIEQYPYGFLTTNDQKWYYNYTNLVGEAVLQNIDVAYKIAEYFNVSNSAKKLFLLKSPKGRLNKLPGINGSIVFDDTYNSSPESAMYSLKAVNDYYNLTKKKGRKIAILGDMLELGKFENEGCVLVGSTAAECDINFLLLVGNTAKKIKNTPNLKKSGVNVFTFDSALELMDFLKGIVKIKKGDVILVKASQGARLENIVKLLLDKSVNYKDVLVRQDIRWS